MWYVTAQAVKEYQSIYRLDSFDLAEDELLGLCASITPDQMRVNEGHRSIWRVKHNRRRLELTVSHSIRDEGPYDQLVRVRDKVR